MNKKRGFTLVELLVAMVAISILASITIFSYNGSQEKARDAVRLRDARAIVEALEYHNAKYGDYPNEQSSSWETSLAYPTSFINELKVKGVMTNVPVDPVNKSPYQYRYYLYGAGSNGCPINRGDYFVFEILKPSGSGKSPASPGFSCFSRDWTDEGWYVVGGYEKG